MFIKGKKKDNEIYIQKDHINMIIIFCQFKISDEI